MKAKSQFQSSPGYRLSQSEWIDQSRIKIGQELEIEYIDWTPNAWGYGGPSINKSGLDFDQSVTLVAVAPDHLLVTQGDSKKRHAMPFWALGKPAIEFDINEQYTAVINGLGIKVGCVEVPLEMMEKLVELVKNH